MLNCEMMLSLAQMGKKRKRRQIVVQNPNPNLPPSNHIPQTLPPSTTYNNNIAPSLPYSQVDCSLRSLAGQAEGFGRFAIGGLHGPIYPVTTLLDDGPGSLRAGCRKKEPLWIVFEVSGTIELSSCLNVSSYKTIDGRGQRIKLSGKGLRLKKCEHVIVCNLEFAGGRGPGVDGIQIKSNSKHIWIDRCSLKDYDGGLIDITRQSTNITISRCYFSNHDKTMLVGADASHHGDRCMYVTIHHCFFDGTRQRHPRVRFAKVHLYNNYTRNWGIHAVCASVESQIYSQCNIYEAGQKRVAFKYLTEKAGDKEEACTGCIISEGDLFMTGTQRGLPETTATSGSFHPIQHYQTWTIQPATIWLKHILQHCSGWQAFAHPPVTYKFVGEPAASSSRKEPEKEKQKEDKYAGFLRYIEQYEKMIAKKAEKLKLMQKKLDVMVEREKHKKLEQEKVNLDYYFSPHTHLTGRELNAVLAYKAELRDIYQWEF